MKNLIESVKEILKQRKKLKNEATTTSSVAGYQTPYAFSRRGAKGNTKAANQLGFKIVDRYSDLNEEYEDEYDLNNDGKITAGDAVIAARNEKGRKKTQPKKSRQYGRKRKKINNFLRNKKKKSKIYEGLKSSINSFKNEDQTTFPSTDVNDQPDETKTIDIQDTYLNFQKKLNDSSETLKNSLQSSILSKLLGKKVTARSSKGEGQSISDYTFSVTGVDIDYYNNKYYIVLTGKEDGKTKTTRFLLQPFYKIKSHGLSKTLKPSDLERIKRYRKLIKDTDSTPESSTADKRNVTKDEVPTKPSEPVRPDQRQETRPERSPERTERPKMDLPKTQSQQQR